METPTPKDAKMPKRIQLSRKKGWRMPPNAVRVDRSTKWGNPFISGKTIITVPIRATSIYIEEKEIEFIEPLSPDLSVRAYRSWLTSSPFGKMRMKQARRELRGKDLACWCKPGDLCHADVLLELANK